MPATATTRVPDGAEASNPWTRSEVIRDAEHRHAIERRCHARHVFERPWHEDAVRRRCGVERLTKPTARQHSVVQIGRRHHQHIDVPAQCEVLKPIVEQHHRGSRIASRQVGRRDGDRRTRAPEHQAARAPASVARRPSSRRARARDSHRSRPQRHQLRAVARNRGSESRDADPCRAASAPAQRRWASCRCRQQTGCRH